MIDREEQFAEQAAEHARLRAAHDAEVNRIAEEIIGEVLAERSPLEKELSARESQALERELETIAGQIEERGEIEIGTLPAIRRAVMVRQVRGDTALTLAYRLGSRAGRRATRSAADCGGISP